MNNLVTLEEYSQTYQMSEEVIMQEIHKGSLVGKKVNEQWFIVDTLLSSKESAPQEESVPLSLGWRLLNALSSGPLIAISVGSFFASGKSLMEGEQGYTFVFSAIAALPIVFLFILLIKNANFHKFILACGIFSFIGIAS